LRFSPTVIGTPPSVLPIRWGYLPGDLTLQGRAFLALEQATRSWGLTDYRWRGSGLEDSCFYGHVWLLRKRPAGDDIDFTVHHPEHGEKTQIVHDPNSVARAVTLVGQLSQHEHIEVVSRGGI
jgi:hypothetical protein